MVLANFLLSPEAQLCKLSPEWWGDFPALDPAKMDEATRAAFAAVDLGAATLPADALARAAVPEIPAEYLEALERGWEEHVLHAD
jgi:putative spermidine/putrescine transport system substrate-binding protein